jgi:low affinity Fe/Cu permease
MYRRSHFSRFAARAARAVGHPLSFATACAAIVAWGVAGPLFHFSDTWQLAINTATTVVTFLMVFLVQNTQNRDGAAVQLKLDEVIRAIHGAHNALIDLEELTDEELVELRRRYQNLAETARENLRKGLQDTSAEEIPPP